MDTTTLARLRRDTPAADVRIHFNNAGSSLMPAPVFDVLTRYLADERDLGGYEAEAANAGVLARYYSAFAELLRVQPDEIAYVENATRAWDMAVYGLKLGEGDEVPLHASEYSSNYMAFLQIARRTGMRIVLVPSDGSGQIDVAALARLVTSRTRVVAVTHVPTQGGLVNPVAEVGRVARAHGLIYVLDACQSAGQIDLNVPEIGCDVLSGTGRKFLRGPRGTGFLYVSRRVMPLIEPPFVDMHAARWTGREAYEFLPDARRFENFESFLGGRAALAAAVDYALAIGLPVIEARVQGLAAALRAALAEVPGVTVTDLGAVKSGICTFIVAGKPAAEVAAGLAARGINVSVSSVALIDFEERGLEALVRASVHYFNTEEEVARMVAAVADVSERGRFGN